MNVIPIKSTKLRNISLDLLFQIIKSPCHNGYLHGNTITQLHHILTKTHFDDYSQLQKRKEKPAIKCESEFPINPLTRVTEEYKKTTKKIHFIENSIQPTKTNLTFHLYICWSTSGSQTTLASYILPPSSSFFKADLTVQGKKLHIVLKKLKV